MAIRVSIEGLRFRASDGNLKVADRLRILGKRLSNPTVIRLRAGDNPADLAQIMAKRQPLDLHLNELKIASPAAVAVSAAKINLPEMIDDSRLPFKVSRGIVPESLSAGRADAVKMNAQEPGRKIRIPTEQELLKLNKLLGNQLEGTDYWIWTETEHENYPGQFVLRRPRFDGRDYCIPDDRYYDDYAVRFVEDR